MDGIQITVTMGPDGSINVAGPLGNPTLCYGMLEAAKFAIFTNAVKMSQNEEKRIVAPPPGLRIVD